MWIKKAIDTTYLGAVKAEIIASLSGNVPVERQPHLVDHAAPLPLAEDGHVHVGPRLGDGDAVQRSLHRSDVVLVGQAPVVIWVASVVV